MSKPSLSQRGVFGEEGAGCDRTSAEGANKASVVVSFPDGSRWLMELTPLQPTTQTQLPTLTQVANLTPIQTDGSAEVKMAAIDWSPATTGSGLEPIQEANTDEKMDVVVSERGIFISGHAGSDGGRPEPFGTDPSYRC